MSEPQRPVDVPALTGLRAFAAVAVVMHHLRPLTDEIAPRSVAETARPLLDGGLLGVDVFFVLSGFVIAHTYARRLTDRAPSAVRTYLVARLGRVYPLHLVTFLAMCALVAVTASQGVVVDRNVEYTPLGFVGNLFMLQALPGIPAWNMPAWSISCELAAYLAFPLLAAWVLRLRWSTALAGACAALCLQVLVMHQLSGTAFDQLSTYWPRIIGEFVAGTLLWVVWTQVLRPSRWGDVALVLCGAGAIAVLWSGHSWLLAVPLMAAMVPAAACATGPIARLLVHPVTRWGGHISYALYLVHIAVLVLATVYVVPDDAGLSRSATTSALVLGGILLASILAAAALHHGVEEPARRWVRRRFGASTGDARHRHDAQTLPA